MEKLRGFRLGRRLGRLWRCLRCPRSKYTAYLRLTTKPSTSPSGSPQRRLQHHHHDKERTEITDVIAHWGRCLARCFGPSSRLRFGSADGGDNGRRRRLQGDECSLSLLSRNHLLASQYEYEKQSVRRRRRKKQQESEAAAVAAWPKPPPKGHVVVYVGQKDGGPLYRAVVPVIYFNHPLFGELLRESSEEFGYHHPGGITIPCPISDFEDVRTRVAAAAAAGVSCRHHITLVGFPGGV